MRLIAGAWRHVEDGGAVPRTYYVGRCVACRERFAWPKRLRIDGCLRCGALLQSTRRDFGRFVLLQNGQDTAASRDARASWDGQQIAASPAVSVQPFICPTCGRGLVRSTNGDHWLCGYEHGPWRVTPDGNVWRWCVRGNNSAGQRQ